MSKTWILSHSPQGEVRHDEGKHEKQTALHSGTVRDTAHSTAGAGQNNSHVLSQIDAVRMIDETPRAIQHKFVTVSSLSLRRS